MDWLRRFGAWVPYEHRVRALLPHLLADVNRAPALADLLAHQLGKSFLEGLNAKPEEAL